MKPNKDGIWEWFDENNKKHLVAVCNCGSETIPYLRVYWWGGYYNVHYLPVDPECPNDPFCKAEWADKWGNYVGPHGSIPDEQLYLSPTKEQHKKILETGAL